MLAAYLDDDSLIAWSFLIVTDKPVTNMWDEAESGTTFIPQEADGANVIVASILRANMIPFAVDH